MNRTSVMSGSLLFLVGLAGPAGAELQKAPAKLQLQSDVKIETLQAARQPMPLGTVRHPSLGELRVACFGTPLTCRVSDAKGNTEQAQPQAQSQEGGGTSIKIKVTILGSGVEIDIKTGGKGGRKGGKGGETETPTEPAGGGESTGGETEAAPAEPAPK